MIRRHAAVWTCGECYALFHIHCVQKWSAKSLVAGAAEDAARNWRCPACQHTRLDPPQAAVMFPAQELALFVHSSFVPVCVCSVCVEHEHSQTTRATYCRIRVARRAVGAVCSSRTRRAAAVSTPVRCNVIRARVRRVLHSVHYVRAIVAKQYVVVFFQQIY